MEHTFQQVVQFTTPPTDPSANIFKTFYLNISYIVFNTTLIKSCINTDFRIAMFLFNNARKLNSSSTIQGNIVSWIKEENNLKRSDLKKRTQLVQETSVDIFFTASINHIFKTRKNAF